MIRFSGNVIGDWNGDGVSGQGTYTVRGGNGALKQRFAAATSKQLKIVGNHTELLLDFTGLE